MTNVYILATALSILRCYKGELYYRDVKAITDDNLITASSAGGLLLAQNIFAKLDVFSRDTLTAWYNYFDTGDPKYFYNLMQTLAP